MFNNSNHKDSNTKFETREHIHLHLQKDQNKYLGINIIKTAQDIHPENYKKFLREIKDILKN